MILLTFTKIHDQFNFSKSTCTKITGGLFFSFKWTRYVCLSSTENRDLRLHNKSLMYQLGNNMFRLFWVFLVDEREHHSNFDVGQTQAKIWEGTINSTKKSAGNQSYYNYLWWSGVSVQWCMLMNGCTCLSVCLCV